MSLNILAATQRLIDRHHRDTHFRAVVTGTDGDRVFIRRIDQADPDSQSYARLASYDSPQVGDEVLLVRLGRTGYIVMGHVLR